MYQDDPRRIGQETFSLHQKHGIHTLDSTALVGMLLQMTLFLGVFDAVRRGVSSHGGFLWIKDLIMPDPVLAGICAILTGVSAVISGNMPESQRLLMIVVPATLTLLFLWQISSGIAIYSLSSSLVGVLQSFLVRRRAARMAVC
jgi:membrane protein insertase Oxa1/YidC/SpoIIIJ